MSLYALPVSISDLIQLQFGLEFFTDTTEATTQEGLINQNQTTTTVSSYAQQLLVNNISLSQVAMAVDSLMFGVTDNVTELAKLSTQFLPAQVASAVASGFNPTVYAAEALGLGLAGGNGTSNSFASDFGSLSVAQFASEVGSITGVNTGAIQGFVQNWITFYTANPSATFGLSVTLASYGAAFGDTVGAALLNPTVNGTLALLTSEVQNALIDNAEGQSLYVAGLRLITEQPHPALQGEAFIIPDTETTIDWTAQVGSGNYAQFDASRTNPELTINNAPSTFTLNTQHYAAPEAMINASGGHGTLFTLILGDGDNGGSLDELTINNYPTTEIVVAGPAGSTLGINGIETDLGAAQGDLLIAGASPLQLGKIKPDLGTEGELSVAAETITDYGVNLTIGATNAHTIDASNAPGVTMLAPANTLEKAAGVTVLGGTELDGNVLQGSLGLSVNTVIFSNGSTGLVATDYVGADNLTAGTTGGDAIFGDGGADIITLPSNHSTVDRVVFGMDLMGANDDVLAITDGADQAYLGSWGVGTTPAPIPLLFPGQNTGGTSVDMTTITGFHAGSADDILDFKLAAWNGDSAGFAGLASDKGDLVGLTGAFVVAPGAAELSTVWVNSGSNSLLNVTDNILRYVPSDAPLQNAQQLAAQLHTASDAVILPGGGFITAGQHAHILVAYDAGNNAVNIADVDLVNTTTSNQTSTANVNVYASDMVHLVGVSLSSLTPDNIHFI